MSINLIIAIVIIIGAFLVIRFAVKVIAKVIAILLIIVVALYFLFFWKGGLLNLGNNEFMLQELETKYCAEQIDAAKCDCIIQPLIEDIRSNYSEAEIERMQKHKLRSMQVILASAKRQKAEIKNCLKERGSDLKWNDFLKELQNLEIDEKIKQTIDELNDKNDH